MPQQWIDDDLKGAEALAYRLDLDVYGTKCGYFFTIIISFFTSVFQRFFKVSH
jgi:hypothetical protein